MWRVCGYCGSDMCKCFKLGPPISNKVLRLLKKLADADASETQTFSDCILYACDLIDSIGAPKLCDSCIHDFNKCLEERKTQGPCERFALEKHA